MPLDPLAALAHYWGYDRFRPLQREAVDCALAGKDSVVVLPTGGGKSLCFQVPAVCLEGTALVVSPLISLMKDQVDTLRQCGVPAAYLNSSLSADERREVGRELRAGRLKLLYVAPERLLLPQMLEFLASCRVSMVAIDEAHCISEWGHDFRPEYRGLAALREIFPGVGFHAYTATATERVRGDIAEQLGLNEPTMLVGSFDRPNLIYRVIRRGKILDQLSQVVREHAGESGVIYCPTRAEVESTALSLATWGIRAKPYHAGLPDEMRHAHQEAFLSEEVDVIVATVAFGMGIDKSNVRFVIHTAMPKSLEAYQQESGRAGRDGLPADCRLFWSMSDLVRWKRMLEGSPESIAAGEESLDRVARFCTSATCRHRVLSQHFGQDLPGESCGACDLCLGDVDLVDDPLVLAQKILSSVVRQGERFGGEYTSLVLKGSNDKRIGQNGHQSLSTYGLLAQHEVRTIRDWIEQLVGQGYLVKTGEYNVLRVTAEGRRVLRGETTPKLLQPAEEIPVVTGRSRGRSVDADSWEGVDQELFERLRQVRRARAIELSVPPYVVFSDATLRDMARLKPTTLEHLRMVKGVGEKKIADHGELFLEAILDGQDRLDRNGVEGGDDELPRRRTLSRATPRGQETLKAAFELFRQGERVDKVATALARAVSTTRTYLDSFIRTEGIEDPSPWVDVDVIRRIEAAADEVGERSLKEIHERLGGDCSYDDIRIVLACRAQRQAT